MGVKRRRLDGRGKKERSYMAEASEEKGMKRMNMEGRGVGVKRRRLDGRGMGVKRRRLERRGMGVKRRERRGGDWRDEGWE
jgi:hypothetical protein